MTTPQQQTPTTHAATQLTLHLLNTPNGPDAAAYDLITRLCPRGVYDLLPLTLHLAESLGVLLEREHGHDIAVEALARQHATETDGSAK